MIDSHTRTIMVGVNGSSGSTKALEWATDQARRTEARIVAVFVLTYSAEFNRQFTIEALTSPWQRNLRRQLNHEWTDSVRDAGIAVSTDFVEADTAAAGLTVAADRHHADLIVLGVHGRGGFADRVLGATTYHVSHRAHQPVVIIPLDAKVARERPEEQSVIAGLDAGS